MNIEVRARERTQQTKLDIVDCDFHPKMTHEQMRPFLSNQWWSYLQTYGIRSTPRLCQGLRLSEDDAAGGAPRRLAADRRPAGERSRFRAASSISISTASSAAIMNPLSPTGQGDQNVELSIALASAANEAQLAHWTAKDARLQGVGGGALRGRRGFGRRSPQARRQPRVRAGVHAEPHRRGRRPQALLADLRGRGRGRPAGRHPRLRLLRLADDHVGLSVVLHRGDDRARHLARRRWSRASSWKACSSAGRT